MLALQVARVVPMLVPVLVQLGTLVLGLTVRCRKTAFLVAGSVDEAHARNRICNAGQVESVVLDGRI